MESLRKLATNDFESSIQLKFKPKRQSQTRMYFSKTKNGSKELELRAFSLGESHIGREIRNPSATAGSVFQIVTFERTFWARKVVLGVSNRFLQSLYLHFKLDPFSKKFLVVNHLDGFHKLTYKPERENNEEGHDSAKPVTTYILRCTGLGDLLLWSFDPNSGVTKAVLVASTKAVSEHTDTASESNDALSESTDAVSVDTASVHSMHEVMVEALSNHLSLLRSPFFPGFAWSTSRIRRCEKWSLEVSKLLSQAGDLTGQGLWRGHMVQNQKTHIDDISMASRKMGQLQDDISLEIHHLEPVEAFLQHILDTESENEDLIEGAKLLESSLIRIKQRLRFWGERAEVQQKVLFNLLTHQDAVSNFELSQATMKLGEATKRDSSSMKTIAIMTMAFLPGTFLSTLFTLPQLQWKHDRDGIVQGQFWIYWAFALPATVLVFVVWASALKWKQIRGRIWKRSAEKDDLEYGSRPVKKKSSENIASSNEQVEHGKYEEFDVTEDCDVIPDLI
ncbi:uncharacterized protein PAC_08275 [Phialocephala subalpina]|uniref:Uncharacterized protein n=1 Tax=Phialocephala subalpina TaxID=576137 RepID=A0A1L7X038_9HELO|nr:uncharacterized protein PAC_08275 [Phialocephala subalpina]